MERRLYKGLIDVLLGLALISLGLLAMIKQTLFLKWLFIFLGIVLIENGIHLINKMFDKGLNKIEIMQCILFILIGMIFIFIQALPMMIVSIAFSFYFIILGIIYFISYLNYRRNRVKRRLFICLLAIFFIYGGIVLIDKQYFDAQLAMFLIGGYAFLLGVNYLLDGIFTVIPTSKKDSLKRRIRIPLPIFLAAIVPMQMLKLVNDHLIVDQVKKYEDSKKINMEIFIHVTPDGFGTMGHVDLCFEGTVYSYGNYDFLSQRLFEAIGDGVLFTVNKKEDYLKFCMEESHKTIFGYGLCLTEKKLQNVKSKINDLMNNTYQWYPLSYKDPNKKEDYASRLYLKTGAQFYKFKSGKFKTYFVMGTNCVLLADEIIGKTGSDVIDMNGIIAPGTYQDYLEKEYQKESGLVVNKKIYKLT